MYYSSGINLLILCEEEKAEKRMIQMNGQKKRRKREEVRKVRKEKGIRVRMAKGRVGKDGMRVGKIEMQRWRDVTWRQSLAELWGPALCLSLSASL